MLLDAAIATTLAGAFWILVFRLRKGSFPPSFGKIDLRLPGYFVFAFALQLVLAALAMKKIGLARAVLPALYVFSYLILLYAAWRNRHLFGMRIASLGIALNLLVVAANLGRMPADLSLVQRTGRTDLVRLLESEGYLRHRPITARTRLTFLGDIFILPRPYPRPCVFSLGDAFITLGACWLILTTMGLLPAGFAPRNGDSLAGQTGAEKVTGEREG